MSMPEHWAKKSVASLSSNKKSFNQANANKTFESIQET